MRFLFKVILHKVRSRVINQEMHILQKICFMWQTEAICSQISLQNAKICFVRKEEEARGFAYIL